MTSTDAMQDLFDHLYPMHEAERRFLATLMWRDDANALLQRVNLTPRHFEHTDYARIFEVCLTLRDRGVHIDQVSIAEELADISAEVAMWQLTDRGFGIGQSEFYADQVLAAWRRRSVGELGTALDHAARTVPASELDDTVRHHVDSVLSGTAAGATPHTTDETMAARAFEPREAVSSYPTPWPILDRSIKGFRPGGLYVIAGDTGLGKSALALQCAYALSKHGAVYYASMEMGEPEMQDRLIAQNAQVPLDFVERQHYPHAIMRRRVEEAVKRGRTPIVFGTEAGIGVSAIRQGALGSGSDRPLTGIVIDYLGLMDMPREKGENGSEVIGRVTKSLKILARDLNVPVILLSQLNREAAKSNRPTRHHLLGSGAIANDADVILLLWRENENVPSALSLIVDKNRQGPEGILTLEWQGEFLRAVDLTVPGHQTHVGSSL